MEKEGGNRERMRKCRESISLHFLIFSPFPHSLSIASSFYQSLSISCSQAATTCATLSQHRAFHKNDTQESFERIHWIKIHL